jgi:type I restriction enzyme M protein
MLTGTLRSQIDAVWNAFWAGGIANPLEVIEQITYLLFIRGLDDAQLLEDRKVARFGGKPVRVIFPDGSDERGRPYRDLRWSVFKDRDPKEMFTIVSDHVFPFLREMGEEGSSHAEHMKGARFTIPTPALLAKVVDMLNDIPMEDRDTKGDLYEYMLGKIATAGQNGQFRTPRHIIKLMVELVAPNPKDTICDPAAGTAGFLVAAAEYMRQHHPKLFQDELERRHFHDGMFNGFDFDSTMLRIGSMNMQLHGIDGADLRYKDSLSEDNAGEEDLYSLVLANPPFAGTIDATTTAKNLLRTVNTKKTELLFLALFLRVLKPGGRAAVIVPDGVLFGSSKAHKTMRRMLVEDHKLDAIIKLPSGVFRPYAGVSTAILIFTKTNSGGTDRVWFYDVQADGLSLDDKRTPLVPDDKFGPVPGYKDDAGKFVPVTPMPHDLEKNNLPDVLTRWKERDGAETERLRTEQSFCVPKAEIVGADYDLSINRYKEAMHEAAEQRPPKEIIVELKALEAEIVGGLDELEAML